MKGVYHQMGVHASHCCPVHGCTYGEPCPVVDGAAVPSYPSNNGCLECVEEPERPEVLKSLLLAMAARWEAQDGAPTGEATYDDGKGDAFGYCATELRLLVQRTWP